MGDGEFWLIEAVKSDGQKALNQLVGGDPQDGVTLEFRSEPPLLVPVRELATYPSYSVHGGDVATIMNGMNRLRRVYRASLQSDRRHLLEQYHVVDLARKVCRVLHTAA